MKHEKKIDLNKRIKELRNTSVKIGYFENSIRTDGLPNAYIATIHEYGSATNNIPPRPTLGPAINKNEDEFKKIINQGWKSGEIKKSFTLLGEVAVAKVKNEISQLKDPPLEDNTIKARARRHSKGKASSKPLLDTKQMFNAVSYAVERSK